MQTPAIGNYDPYDLRQNSTGAFPPEYYVTYLQSPTVMAKIGANATYQECPDAPYNQFLLTGDVRAHRAISVRAIMMATNRMQERYCHSSPALSTPSSRS